jgi:hypothetical protein
MRRHRAPGDAGAALEHGRGVLRYPFLIAPEQINESDPSEPSQCKLDVVLSRGSLSGDEICAAILHESSLKPSQLRRFAVAVTASCQALASDSPLFQRKGDA